MDPFWWDEAAIEAAIIDGGDLERRDELGRSALHFAAQRARGHVVRLLAAGADPNTPDKSRNFPLHLALTWPDAGPEVIDALIHAGADRDRQSPFGLTPLGCAMVNRRFEPTCPYALRLLDAGADPLRPDSRGKTPLDHALHEGLVDVVRALLARGADPDSLPLDAQVACAAAIGDAETFSRRIAAGAPLTFRGAGEERYGALSLVGLAAAGGSAPIVEHL